MAIWLVMASMSAATVPASAVRPEGRVPPVLPLRFELRDVSVPDTPMTLPVADDDGGNPLAISAIDDGRHRLRLGVAPGGRAKLGVAYRLSLGD